eukprot:820806-Pelagomonas_calceolata.AAC.3
MHKAPIVESKQIEHVLNERRILQEASSHQFCVKLCGAYQDRNSLYLLQVCEGVCDVKVWRQNGGVSAELVQPLHLVHA